VKSESRSLSSGEQFQENKMSWTQMNADFQDSIKGKNVLRGLSSILFRAMPFLPGRELASEQKRESQKFKLSNAR
jgi:hypothetical protein